MKNDQIMKLIPVRWEDGSVPQKVVRFRDYSSKCKLLYSHTKRMAFPTPIIITLKNCQQHYFGVCCYELHQNRKPNVNIWMEIPMGL